MFFAFFISRPHKKSLFFTFLFFRNNPFFPVVDKSLKDWVKMPGILQHFYETAYSNTPGF